MLVTCHPRTRLKLLAMHKSLPPRSTTLYSLLISQLRSVELLCHSWSQTLIQTLIQRTQMMKRLQLWSKIQTIQVTHAPSSGSCNWLDVVRKQLFVCGLLCLLH
jgi:hypothetical protein